MPLQLFLSSYILYLKSKIWLSVILGPIGWSGLVAYAVYTYGSPDYQKLISIVATIGTISQRIKYGKEQNAEGALK